MNPFRVVLALTNEVSKMATELRSFSRGHWKDLSMGYEEALALLPEALKKEGFGIITEIDIPTTFKNKLGIDFRRYRIIGACNPSFAHQALMADPRLGVLLPCNVVLYEKDDGKAVLGAVDPMETLGVDPASGGVGELARQVGDRLDRVLASFA